jgi:serine/threonine protein kinase
MILHSLGVLHQDLRPPNILITARDQIKFIDFGRARLNPTLEQCEWELYHFMASVEA